MRRLAQPEVLKFASIAALLTALLCCPRLLLWKNPPYPLWYLEAVLFFGGIVLWAFVFAWHTAYTKRPVFTLRINPAVFALTTVTGILTAAGFRLFLDPALRQRTPQDYPADLEQWLAMGLFSLAFSQLYLVFAPFAWLMRLFRNQSIATVLTVFFGVVVLVLQSRTASTPVPLTLGAAVLLVRVTMGLLSVWFYLRGGLILAWWWGFLVEARHLPGLW